jgi:hypothetical protein
VGAAHLKAVARSRRAPCHVVRATPVYEVATVGAVIENAGGMAATALPGFLADVVRILSADAGAVADLQPSFIGLFRLVVRFFPACAD